MEMDHVFADKAIPSRSEIEHRDRRGREIGYVAGEAFLLPQCLLRALALRDFARLDDDAVNRRTDHALEPCIVRRPVASFRLPVNTRRSGSNFTGLLSTS